MSAPRTARYQRTCRWCREAFLTCRASTNYCGPACNNAAKRAGIRVQRREDPRELGPAQPLILEDTEGIRRRALDAARSGVLWADMEERFGSGLTKWAREVVAKERPPAARVRSWYSDPGRLPFGPPV